MKFLVVGCSHHKTPIALREQIAFNAEQTAVALEQLRRQFPDQEAVLLSTCNRVEVYTAGQWTGEPEQIVRFVAQFHSIPPEQLAPHVYQKRDAEAVKHLFQVAASLDSMVLGEPQILAQVKQAYQLATEQGTTGPATHAAFQAALRVARRVASETAIQQHRVSIPSVAVGDFAQRIFERFDDKKALVIGAGKMAGETLRYLQDEGVQQITVVNRNYDRACRLAEQWGGEALRWEQLFDALADADVVISTTGAEEPVVDLQRFSQIVPARYERPLFLLDLAVPRDFDPEIGRLPGVYLYSIDDLQEACERNRRRRDKELPAAMRIIESETKRFMADMYHRATGPIIQRLRRGWEEPKEEELRRLFNKLPELDERAQAEIRQAFDRLINKLLHPPLESLRDESQHGIPHALVEALAKLFRLKD